MVAPALLELTAGDDGADRAAGPLAVLVGGVALSMLFGGLIAAYLALRSHSDQWPPEGVEFDAYLTATLIVTVAMSAVSAGWASYANRAGYRGQVLSALGITIGLGVALVMLLWYEVTEKFGFTGDDHAYGAVVIALVLALGIFTVTGIAFLAISALRAAGNQLSVFNHQLMRATVWYWHLVVAAWVAVWLTVYFAK